MIEKKAILLTYPDESSIQEAVALVESAGLTNTIVVPRRRLGEGKYGIGSGAASKLADTISTEGCEIVILDSRLKSVQAYNLAKLLGVRVLDREELILEIFSRRASTAEAKLQVELAKLRYEMPRARERVRLAKMGEQPGFYGLGKYQVDVYDKAIKKRVTLLKRNLGEATKRRELHRLQYSRLGIPVISISGYTSAGKTALFNRLTGESKETAKGVFTTLTTHTRAVNLSGSKVLLTDTVGFIRRLPSYMIESFKSTLEELFYSNLVLLVLNVSDPVEEFLEKYQSCVTTLLELQIPQSKILIVLNKRDLISRVELNFRIKTLKSLSERYVMTSAETGWGMKKLKGRMKQLVID